MAGVRERKSEDEKNWGGLGRQRVATVSPQSSLSFHSIFATFLFACLEYTTLLGQDNKKSPPWMNNSRPRARQETHDIVVH